MIRKFHDAKIDGKTDVTIWGTGEEVSIAALADLVRRIVHRTALGQGIEGTYNWFLQHHAHARGVTVS